jgi:hypothetical protein
MKHFLHQPRRLMIATVLALLVVSLAGTPSSAAPLQQGTIFQASITDVRHNQFVVSWVTQSLCTGMVTYGTTSDGTGWLTASDSVNTTTHYVVVTDTLVASTTYYFDTVSNGIVDNNGGPHYTVTTGQSIADLPPTPRTIGGNVYYYGTTTGVPDAIVYVRVQHAGVDSQLVAARTLNTGNIGRWTYVLSNLRTADNNGYFPWATNDPITVTAQGGSAGTGTLAAAVPSGSALIGNITLDGIPTTVGLARFGARSPGMNVTLPLAAVGLLGSLGLLVRRRRQIAH